MSEVMDRNVPYVQRDVLLDTFVGVSNKSDIQMSLTLYVNGLIVCGTLISTKMYLEGIADSFKGAGNEFGDSLGEEFSKYASQVEEDRKKFEDTEDARPMQANFIHLKDAVIIAGDGKNYNVPYWRGRLAAVNGFNFGSFQF